MILPLVKIGASRLRQKCRAVPAAQFNSARLRKILKDMKQTMYRTNGVGLAANQVNHGLSVLVMESRDNRRYPTACAFPLQFYLNAKIISVSKKMEKDWEGCLSIPGYRGLVPRHHSLTFTALTPEGKRIQKTVHGFEARVIQHEIDHLNGFFYVDRMPNLREWFHLDHFEARLRQKTRESKR
ncbi:MAG: peptide deformylase [bacterium]